MTTLQEAKQKRLNTQEFEERLTKDIDEVLAENAPRVQSTSIDEALSTTPDYYINPSYSEQTRSVIFLPLTMQRKWVFP